ncbi:MAG TPA: hypothetical protein VKA24_11935 [Gaiellaceae bacterium]|nr:hypothetical protein [Gaiellaceae bacterium]
MRWTVPPEVVKQVVSLVQSRSVAGGPTGTAVRRVNVWPPSAVESTALLASTMYPTADDGKEKAPTAAGQLRSLAENGSRWNVAPPSSDRRSEQPPPTTIRSGEPAVRTRRRSRVSPVTTPDQLDPAFVLLSRVPKAPAA